MAADRLGRRGAALSGRQMDLEEGACGGASFLLQRLPGCRVRTLEPLGSLVLVETCNSACESSVAIHDDAGRTNRPIHGSRCDSPPPPPLVAKRVATRERSDDEVLMKLNKIVLVAFADAWRRYDLTAVTIVVLLLPLTMQHAV